jgi:hypothetical protein
MENKRYIVLQYPMWELDLTETQNIYNTVQTFMNDFGMKIIMIPNYVQWAELNHEELLQVRKMLDWVLENKNDTDS